MRIQRYISVRNLTKRYGGVAAIEDIRSRLGHGSPRINGPVLGGLISITIMISSLFDIRVPLAPMPEARQEVGVAEWEGKIYVIGGLRADQSRADTVEVYDPRTNRWRRLAPLPQALDHVAAAAVGGKVYALGGLPASAATFGLIRPTRPGYAPRSTKG